MRRIEEQLRATLSSFDTAATVVRAAQARTVAARESFQARNVAFEVGRATVDELLDADLDLARARLAMVDAVVRHHAARVRLERYLASAE